MYIFVFSPHKKMTIGEIRDICLSFPGVTEDIKWGEHLCFNVGGKLFLITSPDRFPVSATFKASDESYRELIERPGLGPAAYLARNKWVSADDINLIAGKEWTLLLRESYTLVFAKLTVKLKKEINPAYVKK